MAHVRVAQLVSLELQYSVDFLDLASDLLDDVRHLLVLDLLQISVEKVSYFALLFHFWLNYNVSNQCACLFAVILVCFIFLLEFLQKKFVLNVVDLDHLLLRQTLFFISIVY